VTNTIIQYSHSTILELTLTPELPQRMDATVKDKFNMRQDPNRHNSHSKILKYYTQQTIPPNKINPSTWIDPKTQTQHERDKTLKKHFTLMPHNTFDRAALLQHQKEKRTGHNDSQKMDYTHFTKHSEQMVTQHFSKDAPRERYENEKKLTSHDYGWLPSLEFPERSAHALKSTKFD
jgi:hypothetical protein